MFVLVSANEKAVKTFATYSCARQCFTQPTPLFSLLGFSCGIRSFARKRFHKLVKPHIKSRSVEISEISVGQLKMAANKKTYTIHITYTNTSASTNRDGEGRFQNYMFGLNKTYICLGLSYLSRAFSSSFMVAGEVRHYRFVEF